MAKKRKSQEQRDLAQLQSDREWLIRTTLIGRGYIVMALEAAKDAGDDVSMAVHARHLAEIDSAVDGCRPEAEDVLKILGAEVARLRTGVQDAIDQMAGEESACEDCGHQESTDGCDVQRDLKSLLTITSKPACPTCGGGRRIYPTHPEVTERCYIQFDSPEVCRCGLGRPCPDCGNPS